RRGAAAPAGAPPVVGRPPRGGGRGARDRGRRPRPPRVAGPRRTIKRPGRGPRAHAGGSCTACPRPVVHRRSPGRSWAAGPRGARTTGLAGRAPRSSRLVAGPLGSCPVLSARGRSARGGSRSGRLGSFVRRGHQLLVVGVAPGGGGAAGQEQGGDDGAEDGDARTAQRGDVH